MAKGVISYALLAVCGRRGMSRPSRALLLADVRSPVAPLEGAEEEAFAWLASAPDEAMPG
jgi:hypothetical protein